jgi:hypothetical protein
LTSSVLCVSSRSHVVHDSYTRASSSEGPRANNSSILIPSCITPTTMCKAQERAQRRHRAVYLAPSAGQLHPSLGVSDFGDLVIPLLVEVHSEPVVISPPSSGELSGLVEALPKPSPRSRWMILNAIFTVYHWCVDVLLLVIVCFMGCFFYDVELKVVKSYRQQARARGRSGRVVIQTNEPGLTTSLLRTPPRSMRSGTGTSHSPRSRSRDMWDV